jgi:nitrogenase molybdenum-iron protein alpha/beta subunit
MTSSKQFCAGTATLPDGLTGALLALEGIRDAAVILNGPTGCRSYHSVLSEQWFPRSTKHEPLDHGDRFFFGQSRIPTTYLDGDDYIFGAGEKLKQAIECVLAQNPALLAVVNAPGAALIGDDLKRSIAAVKPQIPWLVIDLPSLSQPMADGHQQAMIAALEAMQFTAQPVQPKTVALLGISLAHQHWEGSVAELRRLLGLCGIEVICALGAGSPIEEWRKIPSAACIAVIHDEYGDRIAQWLANRFSTPVVGLNAGAPIGFTATEEWIRSVTAAMGVDPTPALADIHEWRRGVARQLYCADMFQEAMRGARFSIYSDPSIALPLAQWLYQYLGLIPTAVEISEYQHTQTARQLQEFLEKTGCGEAWQRPWQQVQSDLLFADSFQVAIAQASGLVPACVEMMLPADSYLNILPKAMLGARGAAYLVEQVINGIAEL